MRVRERKSGFCTREVVRKTGKRERDRALLFKKKTFNVRGKM